MPIRRKTNNHAQPFLAVNDLPEREVMKKRMLTACENTDEWCFLPDKEKDEIVTKMERDCYNKVIESCIQDGIDRLWSNIKFRDRYSIVCYKVLANLDVNCSIGSNLVEKIINGKIDPAKIADMSSEELYPEASCAEREMIDLRKNQCISRKVSRKYTCKKCGKNETEFYEQQCRSLDEPGTIFIICIHCGNKWK